MKTEQEIREKIEEYMNKLDFSRDREDGTEHEKNCNIIDALLWVIGDKSGAPI